MIQYLPLYLMVPVIIGVLAWGLCLGSFTTCVIYRVPRRLSIWRNTDGSYRSFCPTCHAELHTKDLIPVFSWLFQKGRCRYCHAAISARYLITELIVMIMVISLAWVFGVTWLFLVLSLLIPAIIGIFLLFFRPS